MRAGSSARIYGLTSQNMGRTHAKRVDTPTRAMWVFRFIDDQLRGFSGSSGPSQSTMWSFSAFSKTAPAVSWPDSRSSDVVPDMAMLAWWLELLNRVFEVHNTLRTSGVADKPGLVGRSVSPYHW